MLTEQERDMIIALLKEGEKSGLTKHGLVTIITNKLEALPIDNSPTIKEVKDWCSSKCDKTNEIYCEVRLCGMLRYEVCSWDIEAISKVVQDDK